jgi:hypothetical protein
MPEMSAFHARFDFAFGQTIRAIAMARQGPGINVRFGSNADKRRRHRDPLVGFFRFWTLNARGRSR